MSSSFSDFMLEMEQEARNAGPVVEAAFRESQHWIGRLLYERRREQRLTQAKLATLSGIDQGDISKIENAEANPTLETLTALTAALGCTLALQPIPDETRALMQSKHGVGSQPSAEATPSSQPRRRTLVPALAWIAGATSSGTAITARRGGASASTTSGDGVRRSRSATKKVDNDRGSPTVKAVE
jgi:transcriptional regulator with XRE-family HTH domain